MKKLFLSISLGLLPLSLVLGCINEYHINLDGQIVEYYTGLPHFSRSFDQTAVRKFLSGFDLNNLEKYHYKQQSDIAVNLAKLGQYQQSLEMLRKLYRQHPKEYSLAANLGTLYELNGKPDSALMYISKGIALNPQSHNGSEWVHVRILQAKLQMQKNPNWLESHSILSLGENNRKKSEEDSDIYADTVNHITYQLLERIPFTPVPDRLMAKLLHEYATYLANKLSIESAYTAHEMAMVYDPLDQDHNVYKLNYLRTMLERSRIEVPELNHYFVVQAPEGATPKAAAVGVSTTVNNSVQWHSYTHWYTIGGSLLLLLTGVLFFFYWKRNQPEE